MKKSCLSGLWLASSVSLLTLLTVGCTEKAATSESPSAALSVEEAHVKGLFRMHAGASTIPTGYRVEQATYEIVDNDANTVHSVRQTTDHKKPVYSALPPGSYTVELRIRVSVDNDAAASPASSDSGRWRSQSSNNELAAFAGIDTDSTYETTALDNDGDCNVICGAYEADPSKMACALSFLDETSCTSVYSLDFDSDIWATATSYDSDLDTSSSVEMCLRAYGSAGTDGSTYTLFWGGNSGGDGGEGGLAQTLLSYSTLEDSTLYFYLGSYGASSVVATEEATYEGSGYTFEDIESAVLLVAGGGGSGSDGYLTDDGGDGGHAEIASATSSGDSGCTTVQGYGGSGASDGDGGSGGGTYNDGADCTDVSALVTSYATGAEATGSSGLTTSYAGIDGIGGLAEGNSSSGWYNATSISDDWGSDGDGSQASSDSSGGASGGGGFGGGSGGDLGGGGAGGSYAVAADFDSTWCDEDDYYTTNPYEYGEISVVFDY